MVFKDFIPQGRGEQRKKQVANPNQHHLLVPIRPAQLTWRDGQPYSDRFGDVYFSRHNGWREAEHVFIQGNRLQERWRNLPGKLFVLAETGFGSGLNFIVACRHWLALTGPECTLHYYAVEKHPWTIADIRQAQRLFHEMAPPAQDDGNPPEEALLEAYPPLTPGFHRLRLFGGRISLTLAFTDVEDWLDDIRIQAQAWFLDGFAPARNPEMWSPSVLTGVSRNTAPGGTVSTFTAAGSVRRGLEAAGFAVVKTWGYGPKRDMLTAVYGGLPLKGPYPGSQKPWFMGSSATKARGSVTIIGAGLSGAFTADALARRDWKVTVIERHSRAAQEASGNEMGVIFSKLSAFAGLDYVFYSHSYLHAIRHLPGLLSQEGLWHACGVLQLAFDDKERWRQQRVVDSGVWPPEVVNPLEAESAAELAGVPLPAGGLFFRQAGWVSPRRVCEYLLAKHAAVQLVNNTEVLRLEPGSTGWRILGADGTLIACSDAVVLATAADTARFEPTAFLPLSRIRGQVTPVSATLRSSRLRTVLCYDGYITPPVDGWHGIGATFSHRDDESAARLADDRENLRRLQNTIPRLYEALQVPETEMIERAVGRAAFRCHTPDYLPVAGPVPDVEVFNRQYAPLGKGQLKRSYEAGGYVKGLYVNTAHGSRGVTTTPLCAEMIAAYICGEPQPVGETLRQALHPARFVIRALIRGDRAKEDSLKDK